MVSKKADPAEAALALPPLPPSERMTALRDALRVTNDPAQYARMLLEALGRADHPDATSNPIYALYQVAVDYRCSAEGYRTLYLRRPPTAPAGTVRAGSPGTR